MTWFTEYYWQFNMLLVFITVWLSSSINCTSTIILLRTVISLLCHSAAIIWMKSGASRTAKPLGMYVYLRLVGSCLLLSIYAVRTALRKCCEEFPRCMSTESYATKCFVRGEPLDVLCINTAVNYANIGLNNGLSPVWRQTIIETNAGILIIGPWEHILVKFE